MSGKKPNLGGAHGGEATTNEVKRTEFWPPPRNNWGGEPKGEQAKEKGSTGEDQGTGGEVSQLVESSP